MTENDRKCVVHLQWLGEEHGSEEGKEHGRNPLLARLVSEHDPVESGENSRGEDAEDHQGPSNDAHPPRKQALLLWSFFLLFLSSEVHGVLHQGRARPALNLQTDLVNAARPRVLQPVEMKELKSIESKS